MNDFIQTLNVWSAEWWRWVAPASWQSGAVAVILLGHDLWMVTRIDGTSLFGRCTTKTLGPDPRIAHERVGSLPPTPISRASAC